MDIGFTRVTDEAAALGQYALPSLDREQWQRLDDAIRGWWDVDMRRATEDEICADPDIGSSVGSILFLPFPFVAAGSSSVLEMMYAWDTDFTNRALLAHGRADLVRNHILNYLFMISRYGHMPNSNHTAMTTRSQTPLFADSVWRYHRASNDVELLEQAYPLLKTNYRRYWNAPHHQTPTGLATNRDLGDRFLTPELAAEAETGWDWTPIYGGDVRRCVSLITNCALVRFARVLSLIAVELRRDDEAAQFAAEADQRAELIREHCWNDKVGLFVEYDFVTGEQLPYISTCMFYALWAGVATAEQARRLVANLPLLEHPYGLSCTDRAYPDPHGVYPELPPGVSSLAPEVEPETTGGRGQLQWMYPAGWAPEHLIAVEGLDAYGYNDPASRVAARFLALLVHQYDKTGNLWEKYNVCDGTLVLPNSRYGNIPMRGWTAAAAVLLGRRLFDDKMLEPSPTPGYRLSGHPTSTDPSE